MKLRINGGSETKSCRKIQLLALLAVVSLTYVITYFWIRSTSYSNETKIHPPSGIRPTIYFAIGEEELFHAYTSTKLSARNRLDRRSEILWWIYSPLALIDRWTGGADVGHGTVPSQLGDIE